MNVQNTRSRFRSTVNFVFKALFPTIIAATAIAQVDDLEMEIEEQLITGSRVVSGEQSVSPVEIFTNEAMWDSAQASLGDFIFTEVLQNNSADPNEEVGTSGGRLDGNRNVAVNLRGMGEENTLVLVDGMRTMNYAAPDGNGWSSVDINATIPRIALARTELLLDGGSAIYGTDAVAGVVNLIPDYGFEGVKIQYSTTRVTEAMDKDDFSLGLMMGTSNDTTSVIAALDWRRRDQMLETDSDGDEDDPTLTTFNLANFFPLTPGVVPGRGAMSSADPLCGDVAAFGSQPVTHAGTLNGTTCLGYQAVPTVSRQAVESLTVFTAVEHEFSDRLRGTTNFSYNETELQRPWEFGGVVTPFLDGDGDPYFVVTPPTNPGTLYAESLDPGNWVDPDGYISANYLAVPYQGRLPGEQTDQQIRIASSLDFEINDDWSFGLDAILGQGTAEVHRRYPIESRMQAALNGFGGVACAPGGTAGVGACQYWNPFMSAGLPNAEALGLANSAELADWIMPLDTREFNTELQSFQAVLSGQISQFELPGGTVGLAVGFETRKESTSVDFDVIMNAGGYANQEGSPVPDYGGAVSVDALFVELGLPVTDDLTFQVAARSEDYDNGYSTTNPKVGFNWSVNPDLTVRGSWGTSFKAPTVVQTQSSQIVESAWINLCSPDQPNAGSVAPTTFCPRGFGGGGARISQGFFSVNSPNAGLKPQESDNWSLGFDWDITDDLSLGMTFVSIDFTNVVDIPIANNILALSQCNSGTAILEDAFPNYATQFQSYRVPGRTIILPAEGPGDTCFEIDASGLPTAVYIAPLNLAARNMEALDISLAYQADTDFGLLSVRPNMTVLLKHEEQQSPGAAFTDSVGVDPTGAAVGYSEYRMNLPFSLAMDEHRLSLTGRWASDIKTPTGQTAQDHQYRADLSYNYQLNDDYRLGLNINNIGESNGSRTVVFQIEADFGSN